MPRSTEQRGETTRSRCPSPATRAWPLQRHPISAKAQSTWQPLGTTKGHRQPAAVRGTPQQWLTCRTHHAKCTKDCKHKLLAFVPESSSEYKPYDGAPCRCGCSGTLTAEMGACRAHRTGRPRLGSAPASARGCERHAAAWGARDGGRLDRHGDSRAQVGRWKAQDSPQSCARDLECCWVAKPGLCGARH